MVEVPVSVESWADDFQVIDYVQGEVRGATLGLAAILGQKETVEATVTRWYNVAYFHLLRQRLQVEPDLFLLAIHVDV